MTETTAGRAVGDGVPTGPLFLVGVPRSGTTLLYKLFCLHPEVAYISNWMRTAPGLPALALVNRLTPRFAETRRTVWFGADRASAYVNGEPMSWRSQLFPRPVEGQLFYRKCGSTCRRRAGRTRGACRGCQDWSTRYAGTAAAGCSSPSTWPTTITSRRWLRCSQAPAS